MSKNTATDAANEPERQITRRRPKFAWTAPARRTPNFMATPVNDRTAKLTTDSDGLGVTEKLRGFATNLYARASGHQTTKKGAP
ncbi:MAG: hypothetical protein MH219_13860 [Marinobacter sp.]|nr:hypothetical protein [Marinobacter sp.]